MDASETYLFIFSVVTLTIRRLPDTSTGKQTVPSYYFPQLYIIPENIQPWSALKVP